MTTQSTLDFTAAQTAKERGMKQSVDHADQVHGDWSERAYELLKVYIAGKIQKQFLAEDFRLWCELVTTLPAPPTKRAFGSVIARAARQGLITRVGYAPSKNVRAHNSTVTIWKTNN